MLAIMNAAAAASDEPYSPPATAAGAAFFEPFTEWPNARWTISKDAEFTGRWKHEAHLHDALAGDTGLVVGDAARKHAVSALFGSAVDPKGKGLVVQYELQLKQALQCGGAYLKLLTASDELSADGFHASTPYTVMFGPDRCGGTNKVHFILRHKSPKTGEWEEKHLKSPPIPEVSDQLTHLYTAVVGADNSVKILVDSVEKASASLLSDDDFAPPVNPPAKIDDPDDKKPDDWIDAPLMSDPEATKPDDWDEEAPAQIVDPAASKPAGWLDDEPHMVADPKALKPDDWDEDEDGEWEGPLIENPNCVKGPGCGEWVPPKIANPAYKGKWSAPMISNPAYVGKWAPKQIDNPGYFVDESPHAMAPIGGIGIELWTMQDGILFDNIFVGHDADAAAALAAESHAPRLAKEKTVKASAAKADLKKGEGVWGAITYYFWVAYYFAMENILAVGAALLIGVLPLILFCCSRKPTPLDEGSDDDVAPPAEPADADDDDEDEDEEPAPAPEPKASPKSSPKKSPSKGRSKKAD